MPVVIALTGATGTVGRELVRLLSRRGEKVRALTRRPEGRPTLTGVEWRRADLAEPASLRAALDGADRLFLLTGNHADMVKLQRNALAVAAEAGIERVVKLSALGASDHSKSVIGLWHYNIERVARESGLAWTVLRPHHFMQNLLQPLVFDRQQGRLFSATGNGAIPFIDARDVAAAAATVLTEHGHEGRTYTLTGLRARTYGEATEILSRILDRRLDYRSVSLDEAWVRRRRAGQPPWLVAAQLAIADYQKAGGETARTTDTVQRLTGRLPRTLHQFAEDHLESLRGEESPDA